MVPHLQFEKASITKHKISYNWVIEIQEYNTLFTYNSEVVSTVDPIFSEKLAC